MAVALLHHLPVEDQHLFNRFSFGPRQHAPFGCVHHAFEFHAAAQPDAIAVEHLGDTIMGSPGVRVCLLVQRSILMVVGIVAVLKAGGAYAPLDGAIVTQSTLEHVLTDSGAKVVLTMKDYVHRVSGTTGKPKGVEVMHGNVTNLVCLAPGNVEMRPGRRVAQLLNIAFDMAAWEILGSLSNGCTLCVRGKSSKEWRTVMKTVDIVIATPSMMAPHDPADYPNIKVVATAGEPCPLSLAEKWAKSAHYYNCCGPTEVTIVNTMHLHSPGEFLTIGGPVPNTNVYVLDDNMKPVPIGEPGVMWAGGACVSKGYLNLPEKTAERYKLDPFTNDRSYMFNTEDLGRWRENGELEHLGQLGRVNAHPWGVCAAQQVPAGPRERALLVPHERPSTVVLGRAKAHCLSYQSGPARSCSAALAGTPGPRRSWHTSISSAYLPAWVNVAIIWHFRIFTATNVGLVIAIHLLLGFTLASWSFFIATPFGKSPQLAAVCSTFLAIIFAFFALVFERASTGAAFVLTLLFPPGFYTFVIRAMCGFEVHQIATSVTQPDPDNALRLLPLVIAAIIDISYGLG
ncbi:hypothetical protein BD414DRAFT_541258 [Trametes punicea]|nr:hypothetical protein BD414DRAFT_541258 [Trametes punicea]